MNTNQSLNSFQVKKIFFFILLIALFHQANTCTTFFIHHYGKMVFGRNYDWMTDAGIVCTNQRGLSKTSLKTPDGISISWVSQYGSITFNQYGKEFPMGGMNEKGLVVELMWLDGTVYPQPDKRPAINVLQWVQYQLDNHTTIEEVIASDKTIRITSKGTPLHYLVADANGHAATIEFIEGKMTVHKDSDLPMPVLTNSTYKELLSGYKNGSIYNDNSIERFSAACNMINQFKKDKSATSLIDQSFAILNKTSQGDYTKWSIVYDITEKKIWFKTERSKQLRSINFSSFNFSCAVSSKQINMNGKEEGEISGLFFDFSDEMNRLTVEKAIEESSSRLTFSNEQKRAILGYPSTISCK